MNDHPHKPGRKESLFTYLERILYRSTFFGDTPPVQYVPHLLYAFLLGLLYVGSTHNHQRLLLKVTKLAHDVDELRVEYTTLQAAYMFASKQSEVARRVAPLGLYESKIPPHKVKKGIHHER